MAQKNKNGPLGTQSSADAQRSEMFEASVLKSASMEAQEIVQEGEKEARKIVEEARHSSVDTQLDAYRRAVQFYFPGADIRVKMTVNLMASVEEDAHQSAAAPVVLDLFDLPQGGA